MKWYDKLYVGESIARKANRIKWKINHNAGTFDVYVITLASNPSNLLDLIPARELLQKHYPKKELYIIGLAKGYEEACTVVCEIIKEVYAQTREVDVRRYLLAKRRAET